ncbi:MAG: hypothetical protein EOP51_02875 [Sphingobacteriales bacterium]|nr:MAG: hypothetical protein EOP51_02875 [Sphingobacteriales bacterium]
MKLHASKYLLFFILLLLAAMRTQAQNAAATSKLDADRISVGDQARLFLEVTHVSGDNKIQWAEIPDTFNKLEIVERGRIDTITKGVMTTYKQSLLVTGFDSGAYVIPEFVFPVIPNSGVAYIVQSPALQLLVQTVAVDTTKGFRDIKGIIAVKSSWKDYILIIVGALVFIVLAIVVVNYFIRNKKAPIPLAQPKAPVETLQEKTLRLLANLSADELWQRGQVKEYYTQLTDILREYIEARYNKPTMELTTDELLASARRHHEMKDHVSLLFDVLYTADMAKFAKAQPLPQEHITAMENTVKFVNATKPETFS